MRIGGKFLKAHKETWTTNLTRVFNHGFGSTDLMVTMWNLDTGEQSFAGSMAVTDLNNLTVTVSALPTSGLRVLIVPL